MASFSIRFLLNRVIKIKIMRIMQMGRVKNGTRIKGASGYFIFLSGYPITPNNSIIKISNTLPLMAKDPTAHKTKIMGIRMVVGTRRILTTSLTIDSPRINIATLASRNMADTS